MVGGSGLGYAEEAAAQIAELQQVEEEEEVAREKAQKKYEKVFNTTLSESDKKLYSAARLNKMIAQKEEEESVGDVGKELDEAVSGLGKSKGLSEEEDTEKKTPLLRKHSVHMTDKGIFVEFSPLESAQKKIAEWRKSDDFPSIQTLYEWKEQFKDLEIMRPGSRRAYGKASQTVIQFMRRGSRAYGNAKKLDPTVKQVEKCLENIQLNINTFYLLKASECLVEEEGLDRVQVTLSDLFSNKGIKKLDAIREKIGKRKHKVFRKAENTIFHGADLLTPLADSIRRQVGTAGAVPVSAAGAAAAEIVLGGGAELYAPPQHTENPDTLIYSKAGEYQGAPNDEGFVKVANEILKELGDDKSVTNLFKIVSNMLGTGISGDKLRYEAGRIYAALKQSWTDKDFKTEHTAGVLPKGYRPVVSRPVVSNVTVVFSWEGGKEKWKRSIHVAAKEAKKAHRLATSKLEEAVLGLEEISIVRDANRWHHTLPGFPRLQKPIIVTEKKKLEKQKADAREILEKKYRKQIVEKYYVHSWLFPHEKKEVVYTFYGIDKDNGLIIAPSTQVAGWAYVDSKTGVFSSNREVTVGIYKKPDGVGGRNVLIKIVDTSLLRGLEDSVFPNLEKDEVAEVGKDISHGLVVIEGLKGQADGCSEDKNYPEAIEYYELAQEKLEALLIEADGQPDDLLRLDAVSRDIRKSLTNARVEQELNVGSFEEAMKIADAALAYTNLADAQMNPELNSMFVYAKEKTYEGMDAQVKDDTTDLKVLWNLTFTTLERDPDKKTFGFGANDIGREDYIIDRVDDAERHPEIKIGMTIWAVNGKTLGGEITHKEGIKLIKGEGGESVRLALLEKLEVRKDYPSFTGRIGKDSVLVRIKDPGIVVQLANGEQFEAQEMMKWKPDKGSVSTGKWEKREITLDENGKVTWNKPRWGSRKSTHQLVGVVDQSHWLELVLG